MKTRVILIGEEPKEEDKPIEFDRCINVENGQMNHAASQPAEWGNIQCKITKWKYDIFLCWDEDSQDVSLYLGHYNSGRIE